MSMLWSSQRIIFFSKYFLENICNPLFWKKVVYNLHITDKVIGHMYDFCNQKVKGNKTQISAIAHNLFSFFFLFKRFKARGLSNNKSVNWWCKSNKHKFFKWAAEVYRYCKILSEKLIYLGCDNGRKGKRKYKNKV